MHTKRRPSISGGLRVVADNSIEHNRGQVELPSYGENNLQEQLKISDKTVLLKHERRKFTHSRRLRTQLRHLTGVGEPQKLFSCELKAMPLQI
jgi:hypothetical protein